MEKEARKFPEELKESFQILEKYSKMKTQSFLAISRDLLLEYESKRPSSFRRQQEIIDRFGFVGEMVSLKLQVMARRNWANNVEGIAMTEEVKKRTEEALKTLKSRMLQEQELREKGFSLKEIQTIDLSLM